ncbi:uncharacterized protein JCM10292_000209 [Rhodotorula paludigena]|uniref:uncharacterized protein n=1 Tax=Rhodotorula paludigena TaxID=86838 RepID=UPI00316C86BC
MPPAAAHDVIHAEGQHALGIAPGPAPRPVGSSAPLARSVSGGHIAGPGAGGFAGAGSAGGARAGHARQHSAGSVSAAAAGPQPVLLRPPLMRPSASATSPPAASFAAGQHWPGSTQVPQGAAPSVGPQGRRRSSGAHHSPKQQPQQPPQPPQLDEADPRSWSVASMRIRSEFFIKLLRDLSQKGAFQIELELQMTETMPRLQRVGLPVTPETLAQYAPDMVVLPGCAPKHYLQAFDLWRNWTYRLDVTTFPICGSLVVSFLLDCVPEADRRRTVELLELYRRSTIGGFLPNPHRPRAAFNAPKMSAIDWAGWESYVSQAQWGLWEWRAVHEACMPQASPQVPPPIPLRAPPPASMQQAPPVYYPPAVPAPSTLPPPREHPQPQQQFSPVASSSRAAPSAPHQHASASRVSHAPSAASTTSRPPAPRPSLPTSASNPSLHIPPGTTSPTIAPRPSSASASTAAAPPPAAPSESALGKRRAQDEPAPSSVANAQTLEQQRREADFAAARRAAAAATETNARDTAAVAPAQVPSGDAVFQQQLQRLGAKAAPVAPVAVQPAPAQRQQPAPVAIAPQPIAAAPVHSKPSQRPSKRPRQSVHMSEAERLALAERREDADFWHAAAGIDVALAKLAAAQVEHAQRVPPVESPLHAVWKERLEASRASPWANGQAPPPAAVADQAPLRSTLSYGDFVPGCVPVDFARPPELLRDAVTRDPLDVLRPFPGYPPPPYIGRTTAVPCPPTNAEAALPPVQLTPAPFLPYPDALRPLTDATRAKTFTFAAELVQHVDKKIPRDADGAEGALPAGDALERARKDALVKLLRDSFLAGKMTALPEVAEPEQAQKSRRLVSKFKRRERKRAKKAKKAEKAAAAAAGEAAAEEKEEVLDLVDSEEDPTRGAAKKDEQAMQVDEPAVDEADGAGSAEKAEVSAAPLPPTASPAPENTVPGRPADSSVPSPSPGATAPAALPSADASAAPSPAPAASTPALPAKTATHPPRPSLAASSAASAPAVPSARPRAKSNTMHRRPSVSGPNVHPLAQIYASQPEALRHLMRGKAADIRGIPSDARANALAAVTAQLSPVTRTVGLRTPRLSHAGSPMLNSPPLVPLPEHKAVGGDVDMLDLDKSRGGTAEPALPKGVTALGVTLESPAGTSTDQFPHAASAAADKNARTSLAESRESVATSDNNAPPSAVTASSAASPATESPATSVASAIASTLSTVSDSVGGAVAAVARAVRPVSVDRARSASARPSTTPSASPAPSAPAAPSAAGPSVEASTPLAMKAARRPRHCKRCGRNDCPGRGKRELCVHADELSSRASVVSTVESVAAGEEKGKVRAESDDEDESAAVPAKRGRFEPAPGTHLRPHPLRNIPHHWLAASMPYRPFDPRPTGPKRQKAS